MDRSQRPSDEELFRRFVERRDQSAFATVFDRTAPAVYRFALSYEPRGLDPEDLLQSTFLTAVEKSAQFDPSRDLLAWLLGILVNHARDQLRRNHRALDGERLRPREESPPEHAAHVAELNDLLARAIGDLEPPYREVVRLHIGEGMEPRVVARTLKRSRSTVRSQLWRGLQQLRERLPRGLTLAALGVLGERAVAAARGRVLRRVAASGVGASVRATVARRAALAGSATLLVGVAAWLWVDAPEPAVATESGSAVGSPVEPDHGRGVTEREPPLRAGMAIADAGVGGESAQRIRQRIRLVRADDGTPLGNVPIRLSVPFAPGQRVRDRYDAQQVLAARTDADGIAEFSAVPVGTLAAVVFDDGASLSEPFPIHAEAVHELQVSRVLRVTGHVRDQDGAPIARATIRMTGSPRALPGFTAALTDRHGAYEALALGFTNAPVVWAEAAGYAASWLERTKTAHGEEGLDFRLDPSDRILRGRVVDDLGAPVSRACLSLLEHGSGRKAAPVRTTWSGPDGSFAWHGLRAAPHTLSARRAGLAPRLLHLSESSPATIDVVLEEGASIWGIVTAPDGAALGATVTVFPVLPLQERHLLGNLHRTTRTAVDGTYRIDGMPIGRVSAQVHVGPDLLVARSFVIGSGGLLWSPVVDPSHAVSGRVIDENGEPLPGVTVVLDPADISWDRVFRRTETDASGAFRFAGLRHPEYRLSVEGPPDAPPSPTWHWRRVRRGDLDVEVAITARERPTAVLRGRVATADGRPVPHATLRLRRPDLRRSIEYLADAAGYFELGPLSAGPVEVSVYHRAVGHLSLGELELSIGEERDLGQMRLQPYGELLVELGQENAEVPDGLWIVCLRDDGTWDAPWADKVPRADGTTLFRRMAPGPWRVQVYGRETVMSERTVEISAGERASERIIVRRAAKARVLVHVDHASNPLSAGAFEMEVRTAAGALVDRRRGPISDDPIVEYLGLPPGLCTIRVRTEFEASGERVVHVQPDVDDEQVFELEVR